MSECTKGNAIKSSHRFYGSECECDCGCFWAVLGGCQWFWVALGGREWSWVVLGGPGWSWLALPFFWRDSWWVIGRLWSLVLVCALVRAGCLVLCNCLCSLIEFKCDAQYAILQNESSHVLYTCMHIVHIHIHNRSTSLQSTPLPRWQFSTAFPLVFHRYREVHLTLLHDLSPYLKCWQTIRHLPKTSVSKEVAFLGKLCWPG